MTRIILIANAQYYGSDLIEGLRVKNKAVAITYL